MILAIDPRICPKCKIEKSLNEYRHSKKSINGRSNWCSQCKCEYDKKYREDNSEKIKLSYNIRKEQYNASRAKTYHADIESNREKLRDWYRINAESRLWSAAKSRAKKYDLDFDISKEDIIIPEYCPVLGLKLIVGDKYAHDESPSLDRIIPSKGYVKGNIIVVSHKANSIKNNATIEDMRKVYEFYKILIEGE